MQPRALPEVAVEEEGQLLEAEVVVVRQPQQEERQAQLDQAQPQAQQEAQEAQLQVQQVAAVAGTQAVAGLLDRLVARLPPVQLGTLDTGAPDRPGILMAHPAGRRRGRLRSRWLGHP